MGTKIEYPAVTITLTSHGRFDLLIETLTSFMECCEDLDLIKEWLLCESSNDKRIFEVIKSKFPQFKVFLNPKGTQGSALNLLFSKVNTELIFHLEDDWKFIRKGHFIRQCIDVARDNKKIRNVIVRYWDGIYVKSGNLEYIVHIYDKEGDTDNTDAFWYGYSLNPGLQFKSVIKKLGKYNEEDRSRHFDRPIAEKYYKLGYLRANLIENYVIHIGEGKSTYR